MREIIIRTITVVVTVLIMLLLVEGALRLMPSLIGIAVLERFEPTLRGEVADRLGMATRKERVVISTEMRSDGGPDLELYFPNRRYIRRIDSADMAAGGVDYFEADSLGFCNPPGIAEQRPIHVLTVGGSIPNCAAVAKENNFTVWLGRELQATSYNMAQPGVGPYEYLEILRRFSAPLNPSVVVMAISEGDDLVDIRRHHEFKALAAKPQKKKKKKKKNGGGLFSVSYALAFFKGGIELAARQLKSSSEPEFRYGVTVEGKRVALNINNSDNNELEVARLVSDGAVKPDIYAEAVSQFAALARERGFRPLIVMVPSAYTAYRSTIVYSDPTVAPIMQRAADIQRDWLAKTAADLGVAYFDAADYMQKAAATRPLLYFPSNVHLTPEGHKALAEAVAPAVRALLGQ